MDETNINDQLEAEEVGFSEEESAAFDEGWGDDPAPAESAGDDDGEDLDTEEPAAQPETEEPAEETDGDETKAEEQTGAEQEEQAEAGSQRFTLKFLGEDRDVSLDEMRELAEKGMNYDHVREERDSLRGNKQKLEQYEAFLGELAKESNTDVESLIEDTRVRMLIQKSENEGKELSEDDARAQIRNAAKPKEETTTAPPEKTPEEKQGEIIRRFIQLYPGLKGEDIPQSVWDEANRIGDIVGPYQKYLANEQAKEIAQLKKDLQNQKNRERSTGSRRTAGATTPKDAFDEGWDSSF